MAQTQHGTTPEKTSSKSFRNDRASGLLHEDHRNVLAMFKEYADIKQDGSGGTRKRELSQTICSELEVHTRIEEELFYPSLREFSDSTSLVNEAEVEHASAKQLIKEIESMQPGDKLFDAKIKVLGEYVRHHIKEEEEKMFPEAEKAGIDTKEMADDLKRRKEELKTRPH